MRILMTNHSLQYVGGTEKWTHAMVSELSRRGHDVEVFTFLTGQTSDAIKDLCVPVLTEVPTGAYDLILANHNTCQTACADVPGYKIYTSHGPSHPLEIPQPGADAYVAVSAEVRASLAMRGILAQIISNGVDLARFWLGESTDWSDDEPLHVLSACKHRGATAMVGKACEAHGYEMAGVHYLEHPVWDMAKMMQWADVVVGCGRTAIEALACGCSVYVMDARINGSPQTDGWVTKANVEHLRQENFSTRAYGTPVDQKSINAALYDLGPGGFGVAWARDNADIRDKAQAYLDIYAARPDETDETAEYEHYSGPIDGKYIKQSEMG